MEKLNDAEHINWTARFHKILRKLNMSFPVENIREFRFVLISMFRIIQFLHHDFYCFSVIPLSAICIVRMDV